MTKTLIALAFMFGSFAQANQTAPVNLNQLITHAIELHLIDGFLKSHVSGLDIKKGERAAWDKGDVLVSIFPGQAEKGLHFFMPKFQEPFANAIDRGANGGLTEAKLENDTVSCPLTHEAYTKIHYFKPEKNKIYCVKTRNGEYVGMIQVAEILETEIKVNLLAMQEKVPFTAPVQQSAPAGGLK